MQVVEDNVQEFDNVGTVVGRYEALMRTAAESHRRLAKALDRLDSLRTELSSLARAHLDKVGALPLVHAECMEAPETRAAGLQVLSTTSEVSQRAKEFDKLRDAQSIQGEKEDAKLAATKVRHLPNRPLVSGPQL